jgi:hypothetical protein
MADGIHIPITIDERNAAALGRLGHGLDVAGTKAQTARQKLGGAFGDLRKHVDHLTGSFNGLSQVMGPMFAMVGFAGVSAGIGESIRKSVEFNMHLEEMQSQFEQITGSATKAKEIVEQINQIDLETTGIKMQDLARAARPLVAANMDVSHWLRILADAAGFAEMEVSDLTKAIVKINEGKQAGRALMVFAQAGLVTTRELRAFGVEFDEETMQLKTKGQALITALEEILVKKFGGMQDRMRKELRGVGDDISDYWTRITAAISAPTLEVIREHLEGLVTDLKTLNESSSSKQLGESIAKTAGKALDDLIAKMKWVTANQDWLKPTVSIVGELAIGAAAVVALVKTWTLWAGIFKVLCSSNPILMGASIIIGIGVAVDAVVRSTGGWAHALESVWGWMKRIYNSNVNSELKVQHEFYGEGPGAVTIPVEARQVWEPAVMQRGERDSFINSILPEPLRLPWMLDPTPAKPILPFMLPPQTAIQRVTVPEIDPAIAAAGVKVTEEMATATERYSARMDELNKLVAAGSITQEIYNRASDATATALNEANLKQAQAANLLATAARNTKPELADLGGADVWEMLRVQSVDAAATAADALNDLKDEGMGLLADLQTPAEQYAVAWEHIEKAIRAAGGSENDLAKAKTKLSKDMGMDEFIGGWQDVNDTIRTSMETMVFSLANKGKVLKDMFASIWGSMQQIAAREIGKIVAKWITGQIAMLAAASGFHVKATAAQTIGSQARAAAAVPEIAANQAVAASSVTAAAGQTFATHAKFPFVGIGIAIGLIALMMAVMSKLSKHRTGFVPGSGAGVEDDRLAWLSAGEAVLPKASVEKYGRPMIEAIRAGEFTTGFVPGSGALGLTTTSSSTVIDRSTSTSSTAGEVHLHFHGNDRRGDRSKLVDVVEREIVPILNRAAGKGRLKLAGI